jgi:hypothetical protein
MNARMWIVVVEALPRQPKPQLARRVPRAGALERHRG